MTPRSLTRLLGVASLLVAGASIWLLLAQLHAQQDGPAVVSAVLAGLATIFGVVTLSAPLWPSHARRASQSVQPDAGRDRSERAPLDDDDQPARPAPAPLGDDRPRNGVGKNVSWR